LGLAESNSPSGSTRDLRRGLERFLGLRFERAIVHGALRPSALEGLPRLEEARHGALKALESGAWRVRNEAVKLLGLSLHPDAGELLYGLLADRTPAPVLHRMLGGDYFHCGFERRNAVASLALLGEWDDDTTELALLCLSDPYYEVRSAVCRWMVTALEGRCRTEGGTEALRGSGRLVDAVCRLVEDRRLEVRCAAWRAAGVLAPAGRVLKASEGHLADPRVKVREAVLDAYARLLERFGGDDDVRAGVESCLDDMLLTSVAMRPSYPVRRRYRAVRRKLEEESCST
jgi:hypothetical protein